MLWTTDFFRLGCVATLLLALLPTPAPAGQPGRISAAQLREDVAHLRELIAREHPDPGFSTDPRALEAALDQVVQDLPASLSRDEAWRRLATLNPVFADGHFFVGYPDWRADTQAWLAQGGALFPGEVEIRDGGRLWLRTAGLPASPLRVLAVDGVDADVLVRTLLALVHGDTPAFRARLLAERWWFFYWKAFGAPERYRLTVEHDGRQQTLELAGSRGLPRLLREEKDFERQFALSLEPGGLAVLSIGSFSHHDRARFFAFTRDAFQHIREAGSRALLIDVSANGGGDDALWLEGLMPYLATRPYRTGSSYRKRERPAQPGQAGAVLDGEISTWHQPQADQLLRFSGKVELRIGPATYSSAVLFANVMHDFRFGSLTGTGGAARRSQSGGVRRFPLPHTGLALWVPRFILDPPAGRRPGALLEPGGNDP